VPGAGTAAVAGRSGSLLAYLTAVESSASGCADRVTFTFAGPAPGFSVRYVAAALARSEDASGRRIPVAGSAFLVVRLFPAQTAHITAGGVTPTYSGPRRLPARGAHHVLEVVKTGDFEAVVTWAIGLDGRRPFAVSSNGRTLVVEVG
jgi:hypothetical protein